jgi:hypothetical protein
MSRQWAVRSELWRTTENTWQWVQLELMSPHWALVALVQAVISCDGHASIPVLDSDQHANAIPRSRLDSKKWSRPVPVGSIGSKSGTVPKVPGPPGRDLGCGAGRSGGKQAQRPISRADAGNQGTSHLAISPRTHSSNGIKKVKWSGRQGRQPDAVYLLSCRIVTSGIDRVYCMSNSQTKQSLPVFLVCDGLFTTAG